MGRGKTAILVLLFSIIAPLCAGLSPGAAEDTMLMFVGQDLEVLTIASGKEEAAWSAPAVAHVITREKIQARNASTIAQALEGSPGLHINQTEQNSRIYLRGTPDSALVLFDTVPMGSGVVKSNIPIGYETSLASVKRIEVVRGSGSVLWGPDAFAGVINVVPLSGDDFQGVQTGFSTTSEAFPGEAWLNLGKKENRWSTFLSVSGRRNNDTSSDINVVTFWNDGVTAEPVDTRYGGGDLDDSHYYNVYGSLIFDNWLSLSVRAADTKHAFALTDWTRKYEWEEIQEKQTGMLKLEAAREIGPDSGIRFTGYASGISQDHTIIDKRFDHQEETWFGEVIYDRAMFLSKGLLTLGGSWRREQYSGITVWDAFYPAYLNVENPSLLPNVRQDDHDNDLGSVFGQYRHEFRHIETWAGFRYDNHQAYEDELSFNTGLAWDLSPFIVKIVCGTGYRSPFINGGKVFDEEQEEALEQITSLNVQVAWKTRTTQAAVTLFHNEIDNHVTEDRYSGAGLSDPNSQTIYGAELELAWQVLDRLKLSGNLTLLDNSGDKEVYYVPYFAIEGVEYLESYHDYELGPDIQAIVRGQWKISDYLTLVPEFRYFSKETLYNPFDDVSLSCDDAWIMDLNLAVKGLWPFDASFYVKNLFDETYLVPGAYSATQGPGLEAGMILRMTWQ